MSADDLRTYANILWADAVLAERDAATARAERAEAEVVRLQALADDPKTNPYWRLRAERAEAAIQRAADALERYAGNYPESVFPPDSDSRDAIGGTAMRHAYRNAARIVREIAVLDVPAEGRTSVPLEDLIEEESARNPGFAAEVERWNRALDEEAQIERPGDTE